MSKKKLLVRVREVIRLKHYSITMLPVSLVEPLQNHLTKVRALHKRDLKDGFGGG
jgi:hypothetical protein